MIDFKVKVKGVNTTIHEAEQRVSVRAMKTRVRFYDLMRFEVPKLFFELIAKEFKSDPDKSSEEHMDSAREMFQFHFSQGAGFYSITLESKDWKGYVWLFGVGGESGGAIDEYEIWAGKLNPGTTKSPTPKWGLASHGGTKNGGEFFGAHVTHSQEPRIDKALEVLEIATRSVVALNKL